MSVGFEEKKGYVVTVEADVKTKTKTDSITKVVDTSMRESYDRVLDCLCELGYDLSKQNITIHVSPSEKWKVSPAYDCAMFIAVLQEILEKPFEIPSRVCFLSSLTSKGELAPFNRIIQSIKRAIHLGFTEIVIPPMDISLLGDVPENVELISVESIEQLVDYLSGEQAWLLKMRNPIFLYTESGEKVKVLSKKSSFTDKLAEREFV